MRPASHVQNGRSLRHYGPQAVGRDRLERFTAAHYARHYGARLGDFYPHLLSLDNGAGLQACMGFRGAGHGALFLEQYLDEPIEALVREHLGIAAPRAGIVEVGGLAADWQGAGRRLILAAAGWLHSRGYRVVVFTATPCVANSFRRLRLLPVDLGAADPRRLRRNASDWGCYYDHHPRVFAGPIRAALETTPRSPAERGASAC
ncbi:hypothetical protein PC39_02802 [Salinisphaera sp. PC39]|uniref:thermostable hemolysin n=1 Tax=Salinisphaera sp. PC39 TaxID=1304156 RepID=UPI003340313C